jgi:hypothetical protein
MPVTLVALSAVPLLVLCSAMQCSTVGTGLRLLAMHYTAAAVTVKNNKERSS